MADLWPFVPQVNSSEVLAYKTDIRFDPEGEMRDSLGEMRQTLEYVFLLDDAGRARATELYRSNPLGEWLLPVWQECTLLDGAIPAAATAISVNTSADYRQSSLAVAHQSETVFSVLDVDQVNPGELVLSNPVGQDLSGSGGEPIAVAPVRTVLIRGGLRERRRYKGLTEFSVTFEVQDALGAPAVLYPLYGGLQVMTDPSVSISPLGGGVAQAARYLDSGFGGLVAVDVRNFPESTSTVSFQDATPETRWKRKQWFSSVRGRDSAFWLPSWAEDLSLVQGVSAASNSITVRPVMPNIQDYVGRHILIDDGEFIFRKVTSVGTSGDNHRLFLSPLGRDVLKAEISFMKKVRLDADRVEFRQADGFITRMECPVREVPA
ncbi:hypothetical protein [Ruegeria sp. Ofav3-42]|uniref:hypothetical protein n=1 Tax=Ruegeria sp. Ofav3-42 TaxID=2917759 RepID=UPI001EF69131|nr:hypothetical protein [Ruegeria sp. Ofav3-42]MCG7520846.1 hypothetical protein [Ruegeria sp. Ofav3-42]